ncbi:MAG: thiamine-phosphate pyrophosphorylase [Sulfurimonas sp.]
MKTNTALTPELFRVCDANLNRLKEGIRVVEDILRYKDNNKELAKKLKSLRHLSVLDNTKELLQYRDSINDVLRPSTSSEQKRTDLEAIIIANLKRAQESSRVLEELLKLDNIEKSEKFKTIRYELYNLEKEILLTQE